MLSGAKNEVLTHNLDAENVKISREDINECKTSESDSVEPLSYWSRVELINNIHKNKCPIQEKCSMISNIILRFLL